MITAAFFNEPLELLTRGRTTKGTGTVSVSPLDHLRWYFGKSALARFVAWRTCRLQCARRRRGNFGRNAAARIFEPFFTTKPDGLGTASGLHPSVSASRGKACRGAYQWTSKVGVGTTVTLILPLCQETAEERGENGDARVVLPLMT